ncbi:S8 family peptidase [Sphingosinicella sp. BN140058]|uniref:S8 family peptidase n=1 Tax=Sphingosinicella sp. BN140058 TaxID=1892855 RepID=UPI00101296F8|nr:S8 family peptidase [Sphingosinicella sp. BN140058]QAY75766.1 hypothetical protein ETR14_03885 [Sphingosinicella sp. BN140058]
MIASMQALARVAGDRFLIPTLLSLALLTPLAAEARTRPASESAKTFTQLRSRSLEYRMNWGVRAIRADRAYLAGATGKGVTIALLDTGVGGGPADLLANVSDRSVDMVADRRAPESVGAHGRQTASLLGARLDGLGGMGVAYDATILSIRVDADGSCATRCRILERDLARGIDYSVAQGTDIIALPLAAKRRLAEIEPALERAAKAGILIIAAAGNDGSERPAWPARYAADPRFGNAIIVVGATTPKGAIATWSSKAAGAEGRFLAAPGDGLITNCAGRFCNRVSGTSFSVSYVAGAAALLRELYPRLGGAEIATILLDSAVDMGARGDDPLTGRGMLDVARAMRLADQRMARADLPQREATAGL